MKWEWRIRSENEDDDNEANNIKRSDDQLRSDMEWCHINYEHNDGTDNNPELLRESHSSRSQNMQQNEYKAWGILGSSHTNSRQQTYSIKWPSNINTYTQWWITIHTWFLLLFPFFIFYFLFYFIFSSFFFFLQHITELYMIWTHTKKTQRRDKKWINMPTNINISQTQFDEVTFSN